MIVIRDASFLHPPPSPTRRQTKPGAASANALTRSRLAMKSAFTGSAMGERNVAILISATWYCIRDATSGSADLAKMPRGA